MAGYFEAFKKVNYPLSRLRLNIIDNKSKDNSSGVIQTLAKNSEYPIAIRFFQASENLGFSGGNNLVLKRLLKENLSNYVFLLNVDTAIDEDCFEKLLSTINSDSDVGMAEAVQRPLEHPKWYDSQTFETSWCSGGGVLIRMSALKEVGIFDHRFFLYAEDVDLSWRMWLNGWKCKINPEATYSHFTEHLDVEKDRSIQKYYSMRNNFLMHLKYNSKSGIIKHKEEFFKMLDTQTPSDKDLYLKAYHDHFKFRYSIMLDRFKFSFLPQSSWITFSGFDYGKRREFFDVSPTEREFKR